MTLPSCKRCEFAANRCENATVRCRAGHDPPLHGGVHNRAINRNLAVCLYPKNDHIIVTITRSVPGEIKERAALWRGMQKRYGSRNDSHNAPAPLLACSLVTFLQEQESHSCCGARNLLFAFARQISTAATPYCSLYPPPAAKSKRPPLPSRFA